MASPTTDQRIHGLIDAAIMLSWAVKSYVTTLINALVWRRGALSAVRDDAFAQFWAWINPPRDPNEPLEGSAAVIAQLLPAAHGVVLELGPGSGDQIQYYLTPAAAKITKVYGAEPCVPLHKTLVANARAAESSSSRSPESSSKYEIVTASAERGSLLAGLAKAGLSASADKGGLFDTIICVRVLCSVGDLEETCETMYELLKPGGQLLFCEHTVNPWRTPKGSLVARALQSVYTLAGWTFFVGNCHLTRNTAAVLVDTPARYASKAAGAKAKWTDVQVDYHFGWSCIPYSSGILVK